MKCYVLAIALAGCVTQCAIAADLDDRADKIRPKAVEELWRKIPWCRTPDEASEVAKKENRPILVWTASGPPFGHC